MKNFLSLFIVKEPAAQPKGKRRVSAGHIAVAAAYVLAVSAILCAFSYLHHVRLGEDVGPRLVSCRDGSVYMLEDGFEAAYSEGADCPGYFEFEDRVFGELPSMTVNGDTAYYRDESCEISFSTYALASGSAGVADVCVADMARLRAVLAKGSFGRNRRDYPANMAQLSGAVFSMTGDNYSIMGSPAVMRNGVLYSEGSDSDVCVMYWDGRMETMSSAEFDAGEAVRNGAYQIFSGGPALTDGDGNALTGFRDDVYTCGRKSAVGFFEEGHYCFVVLDGSFSYSDAAKVMASLGCKNAFALAGNVAGMRLDWGNEHKIFPVEADRKCGDLIIIGN